MNDNLTKYILSSKSTGKSDSEIRQALISNGWPQDQIDVAFQATNSNPVPVPPPTGSLKINTSMNSNVMPTGIVPSSTTNKPRKMFFFVLLGFLALVLLVVSGYYLLVKKKTSSPTQTSTSDQEAPQGLIPSSQTASPLDSANAFLKALQNDDKVEAMKWSTLVTNDQEWQVIKVLGKPFLGNSKYTFNGAGASYGANNYVFLDGTVTAADGSIKNFTMNLEKNNGQWTVTKLGFKISL